MKVCFKFTSAGSGSDVWTYSLAKNLQKKGIDTEVEVFPHHYQYYPYLLKLACKKNTADIIHTNSWTGLGFADSCKAHVTTEHLVVHDELVRRYKNLPQKVFHKLVYLHEKQTFKCADAITAVSHYSAEKVNEHFKQEAKVIQNGIDIDSFYIKNKITNLHPTYKNKVKLLFVGNFSARKGADLLPKIMKMLGNNFILFATTGLQNKKVAETTNIISIGKLSQQELLEYYNYCDIFLFPTRLEGLSLTTLEAMACGMPIVTTDCFSMPEIVTNAKGGYLCELDNIKQFVEKVITLVDSPSLIEQYGHYNRNRVEHEFSLDLMTDKYITLYGSLIKVPFL